MPHYGSPEAMRFVTKVTHITDENNRQMGFLASNASQKKTHICQMERPGSESSGIDAQRPAFPLPADAMLFGVCRCLERLQDWCPTQHPSHHLTQYLNLP